MGRPVRQMDREGNPSHHKRHADRNAHRGYKDGKPPQECRGRKRQRSECAVDPARKRLRFTSGGKPVQQEKPMPLPQGTAVNTTKGLTTGRRTLAKPLPVQRFDSGFQRKGSHKGTPPPPQPNNHKSKDHARKSDKHNHAPPVIHAKPSCVTRGQHSHDCSTGKRQKTPEDDVKWRKDVRAEVERTKHRDIQLARGFGDKSFGEKAARTTGVSAPSLDVLTARLIASGTHGGARRLACALASRSGMK